MLKLVFSRIATVIGLVILISSSSWAVPPWGETSGPADVGSIDAPLVPAVQSALPSDLSAASSSVYGFCLDTIYNFGTFGGCNCWGWLAPNGDEYAIMGIDTGIAFVNTRTRAVCDVVGGPINGCGNTRWREIKTYRHYCYVASECSGTRQGIMILDLQYLPDSVKFVRSYTTLDDVTCHCLSIDTAKGYLYAVKSNYDGFRVISLADPEQPLELPFVNTGDLHDITAINDTVYAAEGTHHSFSIWNMANKTAPGLLARVTIPSGGYVHNSWPTPDRHYLVTTEETANKTVKIWNISDMGNIQLTSQVLGTSGLAHNAHVRGNTLFLSHYESGIYAYDLTNPSSPQLLARYDTYGTENANFNGAWGVYPYASNGKVWASNLDGRFFILNEVTATSAGNVMSADTITGLANANVTVYVNVTNTQPVRTLIIPLEFSGPLNLTLLNLSRTGTRTQAFQSEGYLAFDPGNKKLVFTTTSSGNGTVPDLPPGSGPVLKLTFKIPAGATGGPNPISVGPVSGFDATLSTSCVEYTIAEVPGQVSLFVPSGCCQGTVGNVDGSPDQSVDIGDLTSLINHLFITFDPLVCDDEANIEGPASGPVDIGDLTQMINLLFINPGGTFRSCP